MARYHRACLGLPKNASLLEGKLFCPECNFVDPAMFGPLHGSRKDCIEWCNVSDLELAWNNDTKNKMAGNAGSVSHAEMVDASASLHSWVCVL